MSIRLLKSIFGPRLPLPRDVHMCPRCNGDWVNPVAWEEAGDCWLVDLRCGACGHNATLEITRAEAQRFNRALDRGFDAIAKAADRLERELMSGWVESFVAALDRDLIDGADFGTGS